jgi:hypothetical protein
VNCCTVWIAVFAGLVGFGGRMRTGHSVRAQLVLCGDFTVGVRCVDLVLAEAVGELDIGIARDRDRCRLATTGRNVDHDHRVGGND